MWQYWSKIFFNIIAEKTCVMLKRIFRKFYVQWIIWRQCWFIVCKHLERTHCVRKPLHLTHQGKKAMKKICIDLMTSVHRKNSVNHISIYNFNLLCELLIERQVYKCTFDLCNQLFYEAKLKILHYIFKTLLLKSHLLKTCHL